MPRDSRPQSVKSETVNGDACLSNNGPGSVPPRNPSQGPAPQQTAFPTSQPQSEAEMADMFSPVSETSAAGPAPVMPVSVGAGFDEMPPSSVPTGGRMSAGMPPMTDLPPVSPFSASNAGGGPLRGPMPMMTAPGGIPGTAAGCMPGPQPMLMGPRGPPMMHHGAGGPMPPGAGMPHPGGPMMMPSQGKVYPPNQPMVFNPANPNAPPIYPCGVCHKEIHDSDQAILCESGCNFWFHRTCTGLTDLAYILLTKEVYAEWVCERCLSFRSIPLVKLKP